ncbi:MAG: protein translocase subunit SecD [Anaerolineae bacterium]
MSRHAQWLIVIVLITAFAVWVSATQGLFEVDLNNDDTPELSINRDWSQGLDLVGGLRVLLRADLPETEYTVDDLRETANNVGRRVNGLGLTEATVQLQGNNRILVELPGVTDDQQAIETIQQTALLEFVDFGGLRPSDVESLIGQRILTTQQVTIQEQRDAIAAEDGENTAEETTGTTEIARIPNPTTGLPFETVVTGDALEAAAAEFQQVEWVIRFQLNDEGSQVFGPFTAARIGQPLAIVLDGVVLSAPTVRAQITTEGTISGGFTEDEAKQLALQLRSGSLPIPLSVESSARVGATLGQESVELSIRAGVVGVFIVLSFMLIYYRVPGIAADLALLVFIALNMALFKLIPVTLTLPAITGFLISIGTAVDGNILIFERVKEELRDGKPLDQALESGFERAWSSIRDSNLSTIIISMILFLFGQTPGASIVSGFAITLIIGLVLNLFTAVIVTRTFLYVIVSLLRTRLSQRQWLLGV